MMWHNGYDMGWPMWVVMIMGLVGLWTVVVLLIRLAFSDRRPAQAERLTPLAELDGRLARGEISPEDYSATRRLLTDGH